MTEWMEPAGHPHVWRGRGGGCPGSGGGWAGCSCDPSPLPSFHLRAPLPLSIYGRWCWDSAKPGATLMWDRNALASHVLV